MATILLLFVELQNFPMSSEISTVVGQNARTNTKDYDFADE